jgi:hypothetical protein
VAGAGHVGLSRERGARLLAGERKLKRARPAGAGVNGSL